MPFYRNRHAVLAEFAPKMDQITHERRFKNWEHVVEECNLRPEGVTVKQWLSENGINVKLYYYWLRRVAPFMQFAAPGGRRCVGERPFCIESGRHR